ncbi:MAG: ATP-binding protein [Bacteroidales bacterium]|jgi:signal transduction histidine kinase/ActR/RegA family two-component response regulator/PAS domain-containing protein|nr:ATP-binding protein [Bacteroidales bacterium]MCI1733566.1 ATP-binding protein [Bacteroidales bacterium]
MEDKKEPRNSERSDIDRYRDMSAYWQTGWWESNLKTKQYLISDNLKNLIGAKSNVLPFEEFIKCFREDYRDVVIKEFKEFSTIRRDFYDRKFPVITPTGEAWIRTHLCYDMKEEDGGGSFGVVQVVPPDEYIEKASLQENNYRFIEHLDKISNYLSEFLTDEKEDVIITKILESLLDFHGACNAWMFEFGDNGKTQTCISEVKIEGAPDLKSQFNNIDFSQFSWLSSMILSKKPVILNMASDLPENAKNEKHIFDKIGIKSIMFIPLVNSKRVWGYFGVDCIAHSHYWNNEDYLWMRSVGSILSLNIELNRVRAHNKRGELYKEELVRRMPVGYGRLTPIFNADGKIVDYLIKEGNRAGFILMGCEGSGPGSLGSANHDKEFVKQRAAIMQHVYDTGELYEYDNIEPSGKFCHSVMYKTESGELVEFHVDTSEKEKAMEDAVRANKLFKDIFLNIPIGEAIYDADGNMKDMNKSFMATFGLTSINDVRRSGYCFLNDRNLSESNKAAILAAENVDFNVDYDFDKVDDYKTLRHGIVNMHCRLIKLYDEKAVHAGYLFICLEDSDHLVAVDKVHDFENFFSLISDYAKIGYAKMDLYTHQGYAVKQWFRNMGEDENTPLNQIVGVYNHMHPEDREKILDFFEKAKAGKVNSFSGEIRIKRPGYQDKWNWIYKNLLVSKYLDNERLEVTGVNYDITAFKENQQELTAAKEKAEAMDKLKSSFLANMSHEIRTPLNAIVGFSDLITTSDDAEEKTQYMQIIHENNDLLLNLINDILDLSKMEAGMVDLHYEDVDVNGLCLSIIKSEKLKIKNNVEAIFDEQLPECVINTDRSRLMQLITNMFNNAIKYTRSGNIKLGYKWIDKEHIRFHITDTGVGISKENLKKIFDRFVKLNRFVQGTGLGLAICSTIIEKMGGEIGVESEEGKGSSFWFILPAVNKSANNTNIIKQESNIMETEKNQSGCAANESLNALVLIAEDTDSNFILENSMLKKLYRIERALDGIEAVEKCKSLNPDLILMDMQMPRMDGLEATRKIREFNKEVPIVAVTAFAFEQDKINAINAGCNTYVSKPISIPDFRRTVAEELAKRGK